MGAKNFFSRRNNTLIVVVVVIAGLVYGYFHLYNLIGIVSPRTALEHFYSKLTIPPAFHQDSSKYDPGSPVDVPPSFTINYSVTGTLTRTQAYNQLMSALKAGGYVCDTSTGTTHSLIASGALGPCNNSNGYSITAQILPEEPTSLDNVDITTPVTGAWLSIE